MRRNPWTDVLMALLVGVGVVALSVVIAITQI